MSIYPEVQCFAQAALTEAEAQLCLNPDLGSETDGARLFVLSQSIMQQATELISMVGDRSEVERQYTALSCAMSELRYLRSMTAAPPSEHVFVRQCSETVQWLPNKLVLQGLQFVQREFGNHPFSVFPRLSRATHWLSESSPECFGVIRFNPFVFMKLAERTKPRCVGCFDVAVRLCAGLVTFSAQLSCR